MTKLEAKINAWFAAGLPDDQEALDELGITDREIREIQRRVFKAVAAKMLARPGVISLPQHRTVQ